jgi:hypothetical protein
VPLGQTRSCQTWSLVYKFITGQELLVYFNRKRKYLSLQLECIFIRHHAAVCMTFPRSGLIQEISVHTNHSRMPLYNLPIGCAACVPLSHPKLSSCSKFTLIRSFRSSPSQLLPKRRRQASTWGWETRVHHLHRHPPCHLSLASSLSTWMVLAYWYSKQYSRTQSPIPCESASCTVLCQQPWRSTPAPHFIYPLVSGIHESNHIWDQITLFTYIHL